MEFAREKLDHVKGDVSFLSKLVLKDMGAYDAKSVQSMLDFLLKVVSLFDDNAVVDYEFYTMPFDADLNNMQLEFNNKLVVDNQTKKV